MDKGDSLQNCQGLQFSFSLSLSSIRTHIKRMGRRGSLFLLGDVEGQEHDHKLYKI